MREAPLFEYYGIPLALVAPNDNDNDDTTEEENDEPELDFTVN